jgi:ribose-phosphate pyrophosphokinase
MLNDKFRLISGTSNEELSNEIARYLNADLTPRTIKTFADGETYVQVNDAVRGCNVFIVQPTCFPANNNLMELLILIDACRRASAKEITAVIPYFGYARSDRKSAGRESIAAKLVANILTSSGADRVLSMDLHSAQLQGYFDIPCDNTYGAPTLARYIKSKYESVLNDIVVVSPDVGGVARARSFGKILNDAPLAIVDKRRPGHNIVESLTVIGDVKDRVAILVDDMIDTGGTISAAAKLLRERGAKKVLACATHPVFSHPAVERLSAPGVFEEVIVTNTLPVPVEKSFSNLQVLSISNVLGEGIMRIHQEISMSSMFEHK